MSEKEKKGIRKCLPVVLEELKKGIDIGALRDKGDCRHDTLYAIWGILSGVKLIFEDDGKWYYTWKKEKDALLAQYQTYDNFDEYRAKLDHSQKLIKMVMKKDLAELTDVDIFQFFLNGNEAKYNKGIQNFLQHLNTGYPNIYKLYNEWLELGYKKKRSELDFTNEIRKIFSEKGFEIKNELKRDREVKNEIFDFIKQLLHLDAEGKFKVNVTLRRSETEGLYVPVDNKLITRNLNIQKDLEEVIEICINADNVKTLYCEIESAEFDKNTTYYELSKKIAEFINNIKLGAPLKGICDACKFTIGKKS